MAASPCRRHPSWCWVLIKVHRFLADSPLLYKAEPCLSLVQVHETLKERLDAALNCSAVSGSQSHRQGLAVIVVKRRCEEMGGGVGVRLWEGIVVRVGTGW